MSSYSKWLWPITVPTGGWVFAWDDVGPGDPDPVPVNTEVTLPAATYDTILELLDALQTVIQAEDATASVVVSSVGIVTITLTGLLDPSNLAMDWASTDDDLSACLGYDEAADDFTAAGLLVGSSAHLYGWYPGMISFGATAGAAHTEESDWVPSWPRAEGVSGSGRKRRVLPSRAPWNRAVGWDLLLSEEILDPDRGIHAMATQAVQSTVRFYPDRDVGTVATPGTQGDPHDDPRDSETDYWLCYLDADLAWQLHGMSGAYRQLTLTIHGEPD